MTPVLIRDATLDDVSAIRRVGEVTWPATYAFAGEDYIQHGLRTWWSEDFLAAGLTRTVNLVAELDGEVVGTGTVDLRRSPPVIWKLYVVPEHQSSGLGAALLEALVDRVPASETSVELEYADGNDRAAAFYARHGFDEVRREPGQTEEWPDTVWFARRLPREVTG